MMQGFAPEFQTPEQYIVAITYAIWEQRGFERIRDWYAPMCPVRRPHGVTTTVEAVIDSTRAAIAQFPDEEALAEDVIVGDKANGFYSSHRIRSVMTHAGNGAYGLATDRRVTTLAIADCVCRENTIVEEWALSDHAVTVQQVGLDPVAFGLKLGADAPDAYAIGNDAMRQRWSDPDGLIIVGDTFVAHRILNTTDALWNGKNLSVLERDYDRAVRFEGPGGQVVYGRKHTATLLTGILAALPDGRFETHHVVVRQQEERAVRVALRWSYCGTHSGSGRYGEPTGVPLALLGITHMELRDGVVAQEWFLVDETAVYAQIAAHAQR